LFDHVVTLERRQAVTEDGDVQPVPLAEEDLRLAMASPTSALAVDMPRPKSIAFARIRAEVLRLVALIPAGKFTTYGSLAVHMNVAARHVAFVLSSLTDEEAAELPWHRVVGTEGRISPNMPPAVARKQRSRLRAEGLKFNARGFIKEPDAHFRPAGPRRSISWSQTPG
jgi:methylated-DNA-protein-cysteine methyltransferase-like protein